jgi:hypothetical protein
LGQADTSPTEVLCKVLLTVAACRKENGLVVCGSPTVAACRKENGLVCGLDALVIA